jgi:hypothetical protein
MLQGFDIIKRFIPPQMKVKIQDRVVDILTETSTNEYWRKLIRSYRSDAEFQDSFAKALERAVQRFASEYEDKELVDALTQSTRFWDLPTGSLLREDQAEL